MMSEVILPANVPSASDAQPLPIGGWLVVVAVGLVISAIQNFGVLARILPLLRDPIWTRLTDPASPGYHPNWRVAIIYEAITAVFYAGASLIALALFFGKRRLFPIFTVVLIPAIFVASVVDHYLVSLIPTVAETAAHSRGTYLLVMKFVTLHVWIPYLLVSKRVKATFIR